MSAEQLTGTGQMLTHYLQTCTYAYNSFAGPAVSGLRQFQIIYDRPLKVLLETETNPQKLHLNHEKNTMSYQGKGLHIFRKYYKIIVYNR